MTSPVVLLRFGPRCIDGEATDVVSTTQLGGLAPLAPEGALIVAGHPVSGLEETVVRTRRRLPVGHRLVGIRPCRATRRFWEASVWVGLEAVAPDVVRMVDGCVDHDPSSLIRALLGDPPPEAGAGVNTGLLARSGHRGRP